MSGGGHESHHGGGGISVNSEVLDGIPKVTSDVFGILLLAGLPYVFRTIGWMQEEGGHGGGHGGH